MKPKLTEGHRTITAAAEKKKETHTNDDDNNNRYIRRILWSLLETDRKIVRNET